MKKALRLFFVFAISSAAAKLSLPECMAQSTFSKVYYDSLGAGINASSIVSTYDDKYIIAGYYGYGSGGYILKIDSAGNKIWSKKIGTNQMLNSICIAHDSNFVVAGSSGADGYYAKINSAGNVIWETTISTSNYLKILSIKQTNDSGFVMSGTVTSSSPNALFIAKTNATGNLQWSKTISGVGNSNNEGIAVKQAHDSTYYLSGFTSDYPPYAGYVFLANISQVGNILWMKKYSNAAFFNDFIFTNNGLLLYFADSFGYPAISKTDFLGNVLWSKMYYMNSSNMHMLAMTYSKVITTSDSCFVLVSGSCSGSAMAKIDSTGNVLWLDNLMLDAIEPLETTDKGFIIVGNGPICGVKTNGQPSPNPQIGLYKIDSLGNQASGWCINPVSSTFTTSPVSASTATCTITNTTTLSPTVSAINSVGLVTDSGCVSIIGAITETDAINRITISPNPSSDIFTVQSSYPSALLRVKAIEITNVMGEQIQKLTTGNGLSVANSQTVDLSKQPNGIYFVHVITDSSTGSGGTVVKKIVLSK